MRFQRKKGPDIYSLFLFTLLILGTLFSRSPSYGADKAKDLPSRGIAISPEYIGITISEGDDASLDLHVYNRGKNPEDIDLLITEIPEGWQAKIKSYSFGVTGVHVESDSSKILTFAAEPVVDISPGEYGFTLVAITSDKKIKDSSELIIKVIEKKKEMKSHGITINTSFPVLQGPTDSEFEFSLEVENETSKDSLYNLSAQGPQNWEINFKPAYEQKFISSLRIKGNQTQSMAVEVKPYALSEPGTYPITVKVSSSEVKAEVQLNVTLTGTYKLQLGTTNGLLSLNANQGEPANFSFYVQNIGSAVQNNVRFLSFKPENWEVTFTPEKIDSINPGELKQVELIITPDGRALIGDYSVSLRIDGERSTENLDLRVTVRASTAWGWVGIGIIVLVIIGLVTLFVRFGRR